MENQQTYQKTYQQQTTTPNKPETKFTAGAVSATIWNNTGSSKDGQPTSYFTVSLQRTYKDRDGNWKHSSSMRLNDLPKAKLVLSKAYEFLVLKDSEERKQ